jgi:hypothetical protein
MACRRMSIRVFRTASAHDVEDAAYWRGIAPEVRVAETWRLSEELWRMRDEFPDESGLCRSVARLRRR